MEYPFNYLKYMDYPNLITLNDERSLKKYTRRGYSYLDFIFTELKLTF